MNTAPTGTILRDEVTENLMHLRDGKTGSDETGLFVQPIVTTMGVADSGGVEERAAISVLLRPVRSLVRSNRCEETSRGTFKTVSPCVSQRSKVVQGGGFTTQGDLIKQSRISLASVQLLC